jgi:hypothetical protein
MNLIEHIIKIISLIAYCTIEEEETLTARDMYADL